MATLNIFEINQTNLLKG